MRSLDSYYDAALADSGPALRALIWLGVAIVGRAITVLFRARYLGLDVFDRVPQDKGVIIAGNHSSYSDPMFVFKAIWKRRVRFMAKAQLFEHRFLDRILAYFGVFPVHADARGRQAIKRAVACLQRGENVGIFPEGTRVKKHDKTGVECNDGVALIAKMADALIVPVGIEGTIDISPTGSKLLRYPRVTLRFGEPVDYKDFVAMGFEKQDLFKVVTDETMRRVRALTDGQDPGPAPLQHYQALAQQCKAAAKKRQAQKAAARAARKAQNTAGEQGHPGTSRTDASIGADASAASTAGAHDAAQGNRPGGQG